MLERDLRYELRERRGSAARAAVRPHVARESLSEAAARTSQLHNWMSRDYIELRRLPTVSGRDESFAGTVNRALAPLEIE